MQLQSIKLGRAFGILMQTLPILGVRMGAYVIFWLVLSLYLALTGWVAYLIGQAVDWLGVILFIVALVGVAPIYQLAYQYVFYMLKAAYIAVVAEILTNGKLPDGANQLDWGRQAVTQRFGEISAMFVVDELVTGVIRVFTGTVYSIASFLPGDTLRNLASVVNAVIRFSLTYVDEAILARSFWRKDANVWESAQDGLVLYAQAWKPLLTNAVALMLLSFVPFIVVFILLGAPIGWLVSLVSTQAAGWSLIATLILAWLIKVALGDAFAMTAIIAAYQEETKHLTPNPEMSAHLSNISDKFNEIKQRAQDAVRPNRPAPDAPAAPAEM